MTLRNAVSFDSMDGDVYFAEYVDTLPRGVLVVERDVWVEKEWSHTELVGVYHYDRRYGAEYVVERDCVPEGVWDEIILWADKQTRTERRDSDDNERVFNTEPVGD